VSEFRGGRGGYPVRGAARFPIGPLPEIRRPPTRRAVRRRVAGGGWWVPAGTRGGGRGRRYHGPGLGRPTRPLPRRPVGMSDHVSRILLPAG